MMQGCLLVACIACTLAKIGGVPAAHPMERLCCAADTDGVQARKVCSAWACLWLVDTLAQIGSLFVVVLTCTVSLVVGGWLQEAPAWRSLSHSSQHASDAFHLRWGQNLHLDTLWLCRSSQ